MVDFFGLAERSGLLETAVIKGIRKGIASARWVLYASRLLMKVDLDEEKIAEFDSWLVKSSGPDSGGSGIGTTFR